MRILLLHLSDIHLRSADDPVAARAIRIKDAVVGACPTADACFVAVSGDIANTGDPKEYAVAGRFFGDLRAALLASGIRQVELIFVPGNHDCNLKDEIDTRSFILDSLDSYLSKPIDFGGFNFEAVIAVQERFFEFEAAARGGDPIPLSKRLYYPLTFNVSGETVVFHCFNTAWLSRKNEVQSQLYIPEGCLTGSTPPDAALSVAIFHHPYNWINAQNYRALKGFVEKEADLILTGHEHEAGVSRRESLEGERMVYSEAPALGGANDSESGFQLFSRDPNQSDQRVRRFMWDGQRYTETDCRPFPVSRNRARPANPFTLSSDFMDEVTAVGTGFKHPRCTPPQRELRLRDVYIYPDLRHRPIDKLLMGKSGADLRVNGEEIINFIQTYKRVLIYGADDAGKTALCKVLYEDLLERGLVPLLIRGEQLKRWNSEAGLLQIIAACAKAQYSPGATEAFLQLSPLQKAILIDDYHRCGLTRARQLRLVQLCKSMSGIVVLFASDLFAIQELADYSQQGHAFADFQACDIKEFGKYHRRHLIEKWIYLGREETAELDDLEDEVNRAERTVATLTGKNGLPHYPFTILMLLQLLEASETPNIANGSYGYMVEALIKLALAASGSNPSEIDMQCTYLSEVAYSMFKGKRATISETEFRQAHDRYCERFDMRRDFSEMTAALRRAGVMLAGHSIYHFKYPYMLYYFAAKYYQLNAPSLRDELREIADHIYNDTNANILIYYVYLTKDADLIRHLADNANRIYEEHEPCDMEGHVQFVNDLYGQTPPPLVLESLDVRSHRDERNRREDEADESQPQHASDAEEEQEAYKYDRQLQDAIKINIALKTLGILGQIMRNFPLVLEGHLKVEIAAGCYALGMRTLNALLRIAEGNLDGLRQVIGAIIKERTNLTDAALADKTDRAIIWLTLVAAFGMVKRISYAVGHQDLMPTYEKVLASTDTLACRIIDAAIKLEYDSIPENPLRELKRQVHKNRYAYTVVRELVGNFLYLHKTPVPMIQALCAMWDIGTPIPRLLQNPDKRE